MHDDDELLRMIGRNLAPRRRGQKYTHVSGSRAENRPPPDPSNPRPRLRQRWRTPDGRLTRTRRPDSVRVRVPR